MLLLFYEVCLFLLINETKDLLIQTKWESRFFLKVQCRHENSHFLNRKFNKKLKHKAIFVL